MTHRDGAEDVGPELLPVGWIIRHQLTRAVWVARTTLHDLHLPGVTGSVDLDRRAVVKHRLVGEQSLSAPTTPSAPADHCSAAPPRPTQKGEGNQPSVVSNPRCAAKPSHGSRGHLLDPIRRAARAPARRRTHRPGSPAQTCSPPFAHPPGGCVSRFDAAPVRVHRENVRQPRLSVRVKRGFPDTQHAQQASSTSLWRGILLDSVWKRCGDAPPHPTGPADMSQRSPVY